MQDFMGNKLEIGDRVAYLPPEYRNLVSGTVTKITSKQVEIVRDDQYNIGHTQRKVDKRGSGYVVRLS